jgi:hypothetical protein
MFFGRASTAIQIPNTDDKDNFGRGACWWQSRRSHKQHRSHDHRGQTATPVGGKSEKSVVDHAESITSCLQPVEEDMTFIRITIKTQETCQHCLWLCDNNMKKMSIIKIRLGCTFLHKTASREEIIRTMLSQDYGVTMTCVIRTTNQCNAYCTLKICQV